MREGVQCECPSILGLERQPVRQEGRGPPTVVPSSLQQCSSWGLSNSGHMQLGTLDLYKVIIYKKASLLASRAALKGHSSHEADHGLEL